MIPAFSENPLYGGWPFWALGLTPQCGTRDIEHAFRDIQARLTMQIKGADAFAIPGGSAPRDEFLLREAKARLLDPAKRLLCEFWYLPPQAVAAAASGPERHGVEEWFAMLGRRK
jgi:hypothetical protein